MSCSSITLCLSGESLWPGGAEQCVEATWCQRASSVWSGCSQRSVSVCVGVQDVFLLHLLWHAGL